MTEKLRSFVQGEWIEGTGRGTDLVHAVTGETIGEATSEGLDFKGMLEYARNVGGPKLRSMTFHERARMLKEMAKYLMERKDEFYTLSEATGATKTDSWVDIEGGIGTFFAYSSKGRREFPNETFYMEGSVEPLSKDNTFVGRHICVPLEGTAVHINAFNFPCWGMLEKLAPTFLGGMPAIVKPATITSYLTHGMVRAMIESKIMPEGALQLIVGGTGDLLDHVGGQDVVTFTGSATTGRKLKSGKAIVENSVRFNQEADSLNFSMLGPESVPGTDEFDLFVKEVVREMTVKAGQKCTAIRRTIVPEPLVDDVIKAVSKRLAGVKIGDPKAEGIRMGPLVGKSQVNDVRKNVECLKDGSEMVFGDLDNFEVAAGDKSKGAFFPATLLYCDDPFSTEAPHTIEAFGPVNTVMPYKSVAEAVELAKLGRGSLVGSLFTSDDRVAREVVLGTASHHGRIMIGDRTTAKTSTGHGSPLPGLVHGGPGRAGGGEELGGARGALHYMQRTALQGSPATLTRVSNEWIKGAAQPTDRVHPFRKYFDELQIGDTLITHRRTITESDVVNFAGISGDFFYAHMDDIAAKESIFEKRVAHGYFVLSAAAGLFVDPAPGPVLANYGLDNLRFVKPVYAGDTIQVRLTCKQKTAKETPPEVVPQGVVAWDVEVTNQDQEPVAVYTILTLLKRQPQANDADANDPQVAEPDAIRSPKTREPIATDKPTLPAT
ncbi:MAG TPA: phenylacetic acid degradation bifunctional protein PaaZ [Gemmatimonadaceae bacterium]|nr:phenylacetic acid degradation bifunctional protein PaaZ [Gemmatimonadaceae bacterium]